MSANDHHLDGETLVAGSLTPLGSIGWWDGLVQTAERKVAVVLLDVAWDVHRAHVRQRLDLANRLADMWVKLALAEAQPWILEAIACAADAAART